MQEDLGNKTEIFFDDVAKEIIVARDKFPSANLSFVALCEELGELAKALLQRRGAIALKNPQVESVYRQRVYDEAVQLAAMACRVATETDASFDVPVSNPEQL